MKKFILLIVGISLFLSACGDNANKEERSSNHPKEENNDSQTEEVAAEESKETKIDTEKKLGLKTEDIFNIDLFEGQEDTLQSFEYENMKIDLIDSDYSTFRMFIYYVNDAEYPSALILRNNGKNKELGSETIDLLYNNLDIDVKHLTKQTGRGEVDYSLVGLIFNEEVITNDLPVDVKDIVDNDFFLNEENVTYYKDALNKAEYKEIYDRVTSYIDDNDISENDSANEIIEILEPIQDYMDDIEIDYDDFDDVSSIYYKGLNDVNNENNIVPFAVTNDGSMNFLIGFEKSGWLFADNVVFKVDGERENFGTFDFDRDVLDGGNIREVATKTNYDEDTLEKILESDDVRIRFEGESENLDYTLTDKDLKAIKTINQLAGISNQLSNLLYQFEK